MSLSGNLGFVPIDEVLRLLTRSRQQGSVDVTGSGLRGRVFVGKGGIDLATAWDDDDLYGHLVNSGCTDANALRRITSGETTLAAIGESNQELVDLLREMTVESLYRINDRGEEFRVEEGARTPYASPKSFDLEALLEDAQQREKDWDEVSEVVPDLTRAISFRRDLGDRDEVTVKIDDWKVLSEIGTGASVSQIADHLGTTEFWAARVAARLVENDLVVLEKSSSQESGTEPIHDDPQPVNDEWTTEETVEVNADDTMALDDEYSEDHQTEVPVAESEGYESDEPADMFATDDGPIAEESDASESWWHDPEPANEISAQTEDEAKTPEVVAEGLSEIPAVAEDASEVEEGTEAFLEKVFSELESSEPEAEEGHGLLRRRRMGTLRDFSSDS